MINNSSTPSPRPRSILGPSWNHALGQLKLKQKPCWVSNLLCSLLLPICRLFLINPFPLFLQAKLKERKLVGILKCYNLEEAPVEQQSNVEAVLTSPLEPAADSLPSDEHEDHYQQLEVAAVQQQPTESIGMVDSVLFLTAFSWEWYFDVALAGGWGESWCSLFRRVFVRDKCDPHWIK